MDTTPEKSVRPVPTGDRPRRQRRRWSWAAWPVALVLTFTVLAGAGSATATATATATPTPTVANKWQPVVTYHGRRHIPDTVFSFAVIPDTQREVHEASDTRFRERTQWLVDHRRDLRLRFVTHTGDVVDWDTTDHAQTSRASDALRRLEQALPQLLSDQELQELQQLLLEA